MDAKEFYDKCLQTVTAVVQQVTPDMLANQTPDDDWSVRDLVVHMLYELVWIPDMVQGRRMAEVGDKWEGDLIGDNPAALQDVWNNQVNRVSQAVSACDPNATAHLSYTDTPNANYLKMTGGDILVHAWDLAKAIGTPITFPADVAVDMWQDVKDRTMSGSGLFKPPVPIADNAGNQDKIIAHFGRDPAWRPAQ